MGEKFSLLQRQKFQNGFTSKVLKFCPPTLKSEIKFHFGSCDHNYSEEWLKIKCKQIKRLFYLT